MKNNSLTIYSNITTFLGILSSFTFWQGNTDIPISFTYDKIMSKLQRIISKIIGPILLLDRVLTLNLWLNDSNSINSPILIAFAMAFCPVLHSGQRYDFHSCWQCWLMPHSWICLWELPLATRSCLNNMPGLQVSAHIKWLVFEGIQSPPFLDSIPDNLDDHLTP